MDFSDRRRVLVQVLHHLIDLVNLGSYAKSLYADPLPSKSALGSVGGTVVSR